MSTEGWRWLRVFIIILLVLQVVAVILAWTLNPLGQASQGQFGLLLSANLVAFAMISYAARRGSVDERVSGGLLLVGSGLVLLFMFMVLLVEVV